MRTPCAERVERPAFQRYEFDGACNEPRPWNWKNACRRKAGHPGEHHTWDPRTGMNRGRHPHKGFVEAWRVGGSVREARMLRGHGAYVAPRRTDVEMVAAIRRGEPDVTPLPDRQPPFLDPDPRVPDDSTPPRLPPDDGNPGTTIALVVLAAIVLLAVVGWLVAVPR